MTTPFQCNCGDTAWSVDDTTSTTQLVCFCKDCQAFANHLGATNYITNGIGGTPIVHCSPHAVQITKGRDNIKMLRLSPNGAYRWYAGCCNTPIGNGLTNPKLAFIGLITANTDYAHLLGPVKCYVNTSGSYIPGIRKFGVGTVVWNVVKRIIMGRITGNWRRNPFFSPPDMTPIAEPQVLTKAERKAATENIQRKVPRGYWVAHNTINDPEAYEDYKAAARPALQKFGAHFLIRGGDQTIVEGTMRDRTVVIVFPTLQAAHDCYNSQTYQKAKRIREKYAMGDLAIVEGFDWSGA